MTVEARERFLGTVHHNGRRSHGFETFDPYEEPQPTKVPVEGVEDFKPIAPHEHSEFSPIMRYDPSRVADHILKNGRRP